MTTGTSLSAVNARADSPSETCEAWKTDTTGLRSEVWSQFENKADTHDSPSRSETMGDIGGKYGSRRLNRSAGPQDVGPDWQIESAIRSIGPYVNYPTGHVLDRRTQELLWSPGDDPAKKPLNPPREAYNKPHTPRRF